MTGQSSTLWFPFCREELATSANSVLSLYSEMSALLSKT